MSEHEDGKEDIRNPDVVTKYKKAGELVNETITHIMSLCKPEAKIVDICDAGDKFIEAAVGKVYNKGKIEKGLGFPTCISVNNVVGHFSPLSADESKLADGDMIKIDLGIHIDGYIAVGAHTFVLGEGPTTGRKADVIAAAHNALECALRLCKPGNKNDDVTEVIKQVAEEFKVNPLLGVLSHNMERYVIDGDKCIIGRADQENKVETITFEPNEVYALDIVMSTGDGKPKEVDERTTVYKRVVDETYSLKMKASRYVLSEVTKRFPTFPFSIRAMDEKKVRFGIVECASHNLVTPYPVLYEKPDDFVAHLKATVLVTANGTAKVSGLTIDPASFTSELSVTDPKLVALLATSAGKKKKKNNKKKKKPAAAAAE